MKISLLLRTLFFMCVCFLAGCGGGNSGTPSDVRSAAATSTALQISSSSSIVQESSSVVSVSSISVSSSAVQISSSSSEQLLSSSSSSSAQVSSSVLSEQVQSSSFSSVMHGENITDLRSRIEQPIIGVGNVDYTPIVDEELYVDWFVVADGVSEQYWKQISGPDTTITIINNVLLKLKTHAVGTVVIEGGVTDTLGKKATVQLTYNIQAPLSTKASLLSGRSDGKGVDLIIVGDGFTAAGQSLLENVAISVQNRMFSLDPEGIGIHRNLWNIWLVESISSSGFIPTGSSRGETLFGGYLGCAGIDRLLCVDVEKVTSFVSIEVPQFDQILVAFNSNEYGGAGYLGNKIATFSLFTTADLIAIHELGHSFSGLADEYEMNDGQSVIFDRPNVTSTNLPREVKWKHWIDDLNSIAGVDRVQSTPLEVGFFEGGLYQSAGVWRPTYTSMMRELGQPLGNVNSEIWAINVWLNSVGINTAQTPGYSQSNTAVQVYHFPTVAGVNLQEINWKLNGVVIDAAKNKNFFMAEGGSQLSDIVEVEVKDNTGLIRINPVKAGEATYVLRAQ